ncbi:MAG TPA: phenylalanine--tRNA ligase subunit beta [Bacteroidia bacterium]|nr:phenylalanine--tRNA ligase subunit beta [Bacteroidia bacterium]
MKISLNWLKEYYQTGLSAEEIAAALTGSGLEVESIESFESLPGGLRGVVIGEVKEKEKHPNADKLSLTKVDVGGDQLLSIVCGAPNVEAGQKVVVATVGAMLYPTEGEAFEIKKSKIRGELSEGMICAEDEIGLGKSHAGIMVLDADVKVGTPAAEYFNVSSDTVLEIGLTPNRADAASHFGVARDLAAVVLAQALINDIHAESPGPSFPAVSALTEELPACDITVEIEDANACKRYSGLILNNVQVGPSPSWLQDRLKAIGLRPINNIVDITNYVMHETGQPLHAFDAAKIEGGKIIVKKVVEGTKFTTLDGTERTLTANDLLICDATKPMCIAGVFGGLDSGVTENTKRVFLESAAFDAVHVRKTGKHHQLKTDSSFRFERGSDPEITVQALLRATFLVEETGAGEIASQVTDIYPGKTEQIEIAFSFDYCDQLVGKTIDRQIIRKILTALGIQIISDGKDALLLSVPHYKVDVTRPADVVEEILRVYGYNNIGFPEKLQISASPMKHPDPENVRETVANTLAARGFRELLNNSLTKTSYYEQLQGYEAEYAVKLINPLSSDLGMMRMSLLFGALESVTYNQNRKNPDQRVFEFGKVYGTKAEADKEGWMWDEQEQLILLMTGRKSPESWSADSTPISFGDLRRETETILQRLRLQGVKWQPLENALYTEGLAGFVGKHEVARMGMVAGKVLKQTDTQSAVYAAEFEWSTILRVLNKMKDTRFEEVSKFPAVRRDLALVIDKVVKYQQLEEIAWNTERKLLRGINLFDVYEGDKLGSGKKSYALSFTLQDNDATLTDKQIDKTMERLQKAFEEQVGASIRS